MRNLILIGLILLTFPALVIAQKPNDQIGQKAIIDTKEQLLENQLKTLYEQFLEAISKGDIETYQKLTTDSYVFKRRANGEVLFKEDRLKQVEAESKNIIGFDMSSARFAIYKNSAVGIFNLIERDVHEERLYNYSLRVTVSFVKINSTDWQIAAVHSTPVSK